MQEGVALPGAVRQSGYSGCVDPQALDLANRTLAAAMDALTAQGAPIIPIVFVEKHGVRESRRVVAGKRDDATAIAKQLASEEAGADATAYAVDGTITYNGARSKGIIVEAWNFRLGRGARIGLRYELVGALRKRPSLLGSPLHLGREGWFDPEAEEQAEEPVVAPAEVPVQAPVQAPVQPPKQPEPDFGPPPTTPPVLGFDPPASAQPQAPAPAVAPPPPSAAPTLPALAPAEPPLPAPALERAPAPAIPHYVPVPIQRNETPLGNRAMFAGIMELATKGRSFPAFAIVQKGGAWEQVTMTDASLADAAASVRAYASSRTDAEFIAFAVDGTVPVDGAPAFAVIVEVWEYATRVSFSVAQRYVPTGDPPSPRLSGRPLMRTQSGWVDVPSSMMLGGQVQFGYRDPESS